MALPWRAFTAAAAIVLSLTAAGIAGAAPRPLETAVLDQNAFENGGVEKTFDRVRAAGATKVKIWVHWRWVAPLVRRSGFDASDHLEAAYNWGGIDWQVKKADERGLDPVLAIWSAPDWASTGTDARPGSERPNPEELRKFARAIATRYDGVALSPVGDVTTLPRVKYWQVWNEPNGSAFLRPQFAADGSPYSPYLYRRMVNQFAAAVHAVRADNVVIAGGPSPFRHPGVMAPLRFMRTLLCLDSNLRKVCDDASHFDVWAQHPYTAGAPTRRAAGGSDVSLGDLPEVRRVLTAATRAGTIQGSRPVGFWITEFAWDSKPPDPQGVPTALHARWTSEALYRAWSAGVTLFTWFGASDRPLATDVTQSGLHFRNGRRKLAQRAFRFPVVAFRRGARIAVWGRTPWGKPGQRVVLQIRRTSGWKPLGAARANSVGIFRVSIAARGGSSVRGRLPTGERSVPFSLKVPRDRFVQPFGCGGPTRPC